MADHLEEEEWCAEINYAIWRGYCYAEIGILQVASGELNNVKAHCSALDAGTDREYCYYKLAQRQNDEDYCYDIDDIELSLECLDEV